MNAETSFPKSLSLAVLESKAYIRIKSPPSI